MKIFILQTLIVFPLIVFGQKDKLKQLEELVLQNQYDKGLVLIEDLISNKEANNVIYYYKACCEQEKKNYESSVQSATIALKSTLTSDTLYPQILFIRAISYTFSGHIELGIIDNETIVKAFPNNIHYLMNMSYLYGENNQLYNSIKVLYQAFKLDSTNIGIINNLAYYNCEYKDYNSAIKYATKGLEIAKDSMSIGSLLNSLGFAQAKTISFEKGLATLNQSVKYNKSNPYVYFNLGLIYLDKNEIENACLSFKKAKQCGGINMTAEYLKQFCE